VHVRCVTGVVRLVVPKLTGLSIFQKFVAAKTDVVDLVKFHAVDCEDRIAAMSVWVLHVLYPSRSE